MDEYNIFKAIGDAERAERHVRDVPHNSRTVSDIIAEMERDEKRAATLRTLIVTTVGKTVVPVIGGIIKELRAENAELRQRVAKLGRINHGALAKEIAGILDGPLSGFVKTLVEEEVARRLDAIEHRGDSPKSATVRRIA